MAVLLAAAGSGLAKAAYRYSAQVNCENDNDSEPLGRGQCQQHGYKHSIPPDSIIVFLHILQSADFLGGTILIE
jgi:hypothetical protein